MRYAVIKLDGTYQETGSPALGLSALSSKRQLRFDHLLETEQRIMRRSAVKRVLFVRGPEFQTPVFGALEEIRALMARLADSGREVCFYAPEYEMSDCYLASAASKRYIHPLGTLMFRGLARSKLFYRQALDARQVEVTVIRRETYKSAGDSLRCDAFDEQDREQWQQLLDSLVNRCRTVVVEAKMMDEQLVGTLLEGTFLSAAEAKERAIIHEVTLPDTLKESWKEEKLKPLKLGKPKGKFGRGRAETAVYFFEGAIVEGRSRMSPLLGSAVGDEPTVKALRKLEKDKRVKAVVLRINSGGGSAAASENILRALVSLSEKKPLAVSMGPVAGSGGYWIAGCGRRLFCPATGITGSIGVISLLINLKNFLASLGITADTVRHGETSDAGSSLRAVTKEERAQYERLIELFYREFIRRAAAARRMDEKELEKLAGGRVWIGEDAHRLTLTDEVGGLYEALEWLRNEAGIAGDRTVFCPKQRRPLLQRLLISGGSDPVSGLLQLHREAAALAKTPLALFWEWYSSFSASR
jgi:protease IV